MLAKSIKKSLKQIVKLARNVVLSITKGILATIESRGLSTDLRMDFIEVQKGQKGNTIDRFSR